jgi:hypothetical protein
MNIPVSTTKGDRKATGLTSNRRIGMDILRGTDGMIVISEVMGFS